MNDSRANLRDPVGLARPLPWFTIPLLTVMGFFLRAFHMTTQSLWFDEIGSVTIATTSLQELIRAIQAGGPVEPTAWLSTAYYALLKAVLWLPHSTADWILRLSSVLLGTATIPAMAWATMGFLPRNAVIATTAALAISPFHVWYSQEVRPYVLLVLISTLLLGAYLRALERNRTSWWVAVAVLMTAALYTHPIALALPAICLVGVLMAAASNRKSLLPGVAALIAAGAAFAPVALWIKAHGANKAADPRAVGWFDLPYAFYAYAVGFSLGPSTTDLHSSSLALLTPYLPLIAIAALVFGGLALHGIVVIRRLPATTALVLTAWLVVPLTLAITIALTSENPFNVRYAIVSYPAFVVLIGAGASDVRRRHVGLLVAGAVALSLLSLRNLYVDPYYAK
jgi:mannosyltransferase